MNVSIIIVSFNTKKLLEKCLTSIFKFLKGVNISFEVIVVDNASTDGSPEMVFKKFPQVKLIINKKNWGFGTANNQGAKIAKGKHLFFLNSDAYLVDSSLSELIKKLDHNEKIGPDGPVFSLHSKIGAVGPLILNEDKTIQQSVGFFPHLPQVFYWMSFLDDLPVGDSLKPYHVDHDRFYKKAQVVDWVTGAALFVKRQVFEKVSGFDEKIFLYGEDVDFCYRIKKEGFEIIFTPVAKIVHLGRGSHKLTNIGAIVGEYAGVLYFYKKFKGIISQLTAHIMLKLGALIRILIFGLLLQRRELLVAYWRAFKVN